MQSGSPVKRIDQDFKTLILYLMQLTGNDLLFTLSQMNAFLSDQAPRDPDQVMLAILETDFYSWLANLFVRSDKVTKELVLDFFIYSLALNSASDNEEEQFNMLSKDLAMSTLEFQ